VLALVPDARLLLAGSGELEPGLRASVAGEPWAASVSFLGARDDVAPVLAACDVGVLPSESEALPTFVMEAAAAGRPVIATDVGGTRDLLRDGRTGTLLPAGAGSAELATALSDLLLHPERVRSMGAAALAVARERFSLEAQVDATLLAWRLAFTRSGSRSDDPGGVLPKRDGIRR
jgi:glycosyltransferase involved in cell wall biosynthesis